MVLRLLFSHKDSQTLYWHYLLFVFLIVSLVLLYLETQEWLRAWDNQNSMDCEKQACQRGVRLVGTHRLDLQTLSCWEFSTFPHMLPTQWRPTPPFLHSVKPPMHLPITSLSPFLLLLIILPLLLCLCTCRCEQQDPSVWFCSSLAFFLPCSHHSIHPSLSFMCAPLSSPAGSGLPASSHALFVGWWNKWAKNDRGCNGCTCASGRAFWKPSLLAVWKWGYMWGICLVFNSKDQICNIYWQKAESNVYAYFHRYLDVWT